MFKNARGVGEWGLGWGIPLPVGIGLGRGNAQYPEKK